MTKVISIELDTNDTEDGTETAAQFAARVAVKYDLIADVVNPHGPAGGAAVVQYIGKIANLERMVYDEYTSDMDTPTERLIDVAFMVHGEE